MDTWQSMELSLPEEKSRSSQEAWDNIACSRAASTLPIHTEDDKIRLEAASSDHSAAWLNAIPSPLIGTLLNDAVFRTAISYRLGLEFVGDSSCVCGMKIDARGLHALACQKLSGPKIARHDDICDVLARSIRQGGIPCRLEPQGLSVVDRTRPDGETLRPWRNGLPLSFDVTVPDSFCVSHRPEARKGPGFVVSKAEALKLRKYAHLAASHVFIPFVIDSAGVWGRAADNLVKEIARLIKANCAENRALEFLRQRISLAVARGNARLLSAAFPALEQMDDLAYY